MTVNSESEVSVQAGVHESDTVLFAVLEDHFEASTVAQTIGIGAPGAVEDVGSIDQRVCLGRWSCLGSIPPPLVERVNVAPVREE